MSAGFLHAVEERALPLRTLTGWASKCFASLPEFASDRAGSVSKTRLHDTKPFVLTHVQLKALFVRFDHLATDQLRVAEHVCPPSPRATAPALSYRLSPRAHSGWMGKRQRP